MRVVRGFDALPAPARGAAVAMGNFDGVHLGHRAILDRVVAETLRRDLDACVLTFWPHPLAVLAPERAPRMIQTLDDRLASLEAAGGVDVTVVAPFTAELAAVEADDFLRDHLAGRLGCRVLFAGGDARFGRGRAGDVALLRRRACEGLLDVVVLDPVEARGVVASSSGIRKRIAAGDVAGAATLLGRPFSVAGTVAAGAGRGTGLGFPTANLVPEGETRPANGIYACRADTDAGSWPAAVHLGPVPTFGAAAPVVEAHLVGFSGDLLGRRVRVHFLERLRDVTRFPDVEALKAAIADDVRRTVEVCIGLTVDG